MKTKKNAINVGLFIFCSMILSSCSAPYRATILVDPKVVKSVQIEEDFKSGNETKKYEIDPMSGSYTVVVSPDDVSSIEVSAKLFSGEDISHKEQIIYPNRRVELFILNGKFMVRVINEAYF